MDRRYHGAKSDTMTTPFAVAAVATTNTYAYAHTLLNLSVHSTLARLPYKTRMYIWMFCILSCFVFSMEFHWRHCMHHLFSAFFFYQTPHFIQIYMPYIITTACIYVRLYTHLSGRYMWRGVIHKTSSIKWQNTVPKSSIDEDEEEEKKKQHFPLKRWYAFNIFFFICATNFFFLLTFRSNVCIIWLAHFCVSLLWLSVNFIGHDAVIDAHTDANVHPQHMNVFVQSHDIQWFLFCILCGIQE